jgi:hypothetical protein
MLNSFTAIPLNMVMAFHEITRVPFIIRNWLQIKARRNLNLAMLRLCSIESSLYRNINHFLRSFPVQIAGKLMKELYGML